AAGVVRDVEGRGERLERLRDVRLPDRLAQLGGRADARRVVVVQSRRDVEQRRNRVTGELLAAAAAEVDRIFHRQRIGEAALSRRQAEERVEAGGGVESRGDRERV